MPQGSCQRPGCKFDRTYREHPRGGYRRQRHCSAECYVWCRRAHGASEAGNGAEAAKLMRISALLDSRKSPSDRVFEAFDDPEPSTPVTST